MVSFGVSRDFVDRLKRMSLSLGNDTLEQGATLGSWHIVVIGDCSYLVGSAFVIRKGTKEFSVVLRTFNISCF